MKTKLKIMIVEPSEIITQGLVSILEKCNFSICRTEKNTSQLEILLEKTKPDVLIINPTLNAPDNRTPLHTFLARKTMVNVFALVYQYIPTALLKNYSKVIDIQSHEEQIKLLFENIEKSTNETTSENYELTSRETDVLTLMVKGMLNKEIADKLNISIHTVITHRKNIVRKTGIKTVAGLTVYAMLNNLMD